MDSALLVSSSDKGHSTFVELLKAAEFTHITTAHSGNEARRMLMQSDYDLAIINAPLSDEFGHDLSCMVTENSYAGVILLTKSEVADQVSAKVENYGVLVVPKPISRPLFFQAVKLVSSSRRRLLGLKNENVKLQNKIEEIRLVDRAKCVLIQYLKLTEPQAHRYIEKQAMDMRVSRKEIALNILKTYET